MTNKRKNRRGTVGGLGRLFRANPKPLWLVCVLHVVALGVALVLYALPHHVIPHGEAAVGVVSSRGGQPAGLQATQAALDGAPDIDNAFEGEVFEEDAFIEDESEDAASADADPTDGDWSDDSLPGDAFVDDDVPDADAPADGGALVAEDPAALEAMFGEDAVGSFRSRFADKFTDGTVENTKSGYRSQNLSVTVKAKYVQDIGARVYVADIYIADISCLTTAFATDRYGRGYTEWIEKIAKRYKSVVTLNGDYYGSRSTGVIIRNGELYRDKKAKGDICVLYWDGHMECIRGSRFNTMDEMDKGAYQSWSFGPSLLDEDGKPLGDFNCDNYLRNKHPRSAIGYFEPGHYCFVAVDGRNEVSSGATLTQLATLLSNMGCKLGYNLDGGQTSLFAAGSRLRNKPSQGGRNSSDYIMIVDRITQ